MECNREEAIRAKGIAEKKMENKDFVGAKKIILKAQQLFPDLDNVSQIITVCDVHCSAGTMVNGEKDWYGILQVEPTADESMIKKQFRKLALLLHPDKNKFQGAEAAFKLIGEAHVTLTDRGKRSLYDMKRRTVVKTVAPRQPSQQPNPTFVKKQPGIQKGNPGNTSYFSDINQQQPSASAPNAFWTICPSCGMRYQYLRSLLNRSLRCQCCLKTFIASELNVRDVPTSSGAKFHSWNYTEIPKQAVPSQPSYFGNASSSTAFQGDKAGGPTAQDQRARSGISTSHGTGPTSKESNGVVGEDGQSAKDVKFEKVKVQEKKRERPVKPSAGKSSRKRGRTVIEESSDSFSEDSTNSEKIIIEEDEGPSVENTGATSSHYPRRSTRKKQNVSYDENRSEDDDDHVSHKRLRKGGSSSNTNCAGKSSEGGVDDVEAPNSGTAAPCKTEEKQHKGILHEENLPNSNKRGNKYKMHESKQVADGKEGSEAGVTSNADPTDDSQNLGSFSYPETEFYDFDKDREACKFAANQIWAVYDSLDGMPRFYARIREVFTPGFKLRFTWLEHNPIREAEKAWTKEELPIACGNYRLGSSQTTQDRGTFSHLICCEEGSKRSTYNIYPRKGEVWALFKGWDVGWISDADSHRLYDYEVVEVLSDFAESSGIIVIHLVKIKGFVSLFMRAKDKENALIPCAEILRFSHRVPSYQLTADKRKGIPEGSFELDTASLPENFEQIFPSISVEDASVGAEKLNGEYSDPCLQSATGKEKFATDSANKETVKLNENPAERDEIDDARDPNAAAGTPENANPPPLTPPSPICYEYPPSEFHDFQEDRSIQKIKRGQIWALYSDVDKYPKYYARVKKVDFEESTVHVSWLELSPRREDEIAWLDKELPGACGRFKVERGAVSFDGMDAFSHLVSAKPSGKRDLYDIYPSRGEVWAVYKDWSSGWTRSDLDKCEYYVAEVLECTDSTFKVLLLTKVDGHNAIFMPEVSGSVERTMVIRVDECLRFSHQIPAFRLTDEADEKLWGYWELDPASVPDSLLF